MPSITKILLLVLIIWVVWRGFNRFTGAGRTNWNQRQAPDRPSRSGPPQRPVEDMVKCPKCGAYVAGLADHRCEG